MTLWTPDGEHQVGSEHQESKEQQQGSSGGGRPDAAPGSPAESLSPEEQEQAAAMAQELAEARAQLLEAEVSVVLANHALGIYELGAIHLTSDDPDLEEAKLAIDGLAAIVEGLEGRLGDGEPTLKEALHQLRLAFVQRTKDSEDASTGDSSDEGDTTE